MGQEFVFSRHPPDPALLESSRCSPKLLNQLCMGNTLNAYGVSFSATCPITNSSLPQIQKASRVCLAFIVFVRWHFLFTSSAFRQCTTVINGNLRSLLRMYYRSGTDVDTNNKLMIQKNMKENQMSLTVFQGGLASLVEEIC